MNPKTTAILLGAAMGAALGAGAAWTYMRQQEAKTQAAALGVIQPVQMNAGAGDFIKIGVAVFALLRQFDDLFKPK